MTGEFYSIYRCAEPFLFSGGGLHSSDHFQAVVLSITFGVILSLTWVQLEAPDIAIAEATVGAGLAGV